MSSTETVNADLSLLNLKKFLFRQKLQEIFANNEFVFQKGTQWTHISGLGMNLTRIGVGIVNDVSYQAFRLKVGVESLLNPAKECERVFINDVPLAPIHVLNLYISRQFST